jgi:hypothetical protein
MSKLVISWDTYSWLNYCSGIILKEPEKFTLIVLTTDYHKPIYDFPKLCEDAVYEQRRYDLFKIGKSIGLKKVMNLQYDENDINLYKLITQLQLHIMLTGTKEVYFPNNISDEITKLFKSLGSNLKIKTFGYSYSIYSSTIIINLTDIEYFTKSRLFNCTVGYYEKKFPTIIKNEVFI